MRHFIRQSIALSLFLCSTAAFAGGCPEGKEGPMPLDPITETSGTVEVHEYLRRDLSKEAIAANGWNMRARTISFGTDAIVQLHSHDERPEVAMMKHGTVTVYESNCTVPYEMKEGDVFTSGKGDQHWVINKSGSPAIMLVVDLVNKDTFPSK